ncbi:MAG: transcription antitermination protein NusB, partial [Muribaculaceae bacterium]|nr:transcription antitermination protein NusB [Muribaculaceae bacterium]
MVKALRENEEISSYIGNNKFSWFKEEPVLMRNLLTTIKESDVYKAYMEAPSVTPYDDAELWRQLYKRVVLENPSFLEMLEEKSVFWNDDLEIVSTFVLKAFRRIGEGDTTHAVLEKFKDEEDARFGSDLLRYLYRNKDVYRRYIDESLVGGNWDKDRIAFMDIVVLETALAEILNFPKIPLKVSVNEYIELAKSYSTAKSGQFVHGVLGNIIDRLQQEGMLYKK